MTLADVERRFMRHEGFRRAVFMLMHATEMLIKIEAEIKRRQQATSQNMRPMTIAEFQAKHRRP